MKKMERRDFLKTGALLGVSALAMGPLISCLGKAKKASITPKTWPDIAAAKSSDYFAGAKKAIEELGGMGRFVPAGAKVAILANVQRNNPGVYTKPEILRAVLRMCREAKAAEINCLSWLPQKNWDDTGLAKVIAEEGARLVLVDGKDDSQFRNMPVPRGKALKEVKVISVFFEHDVFIDMPITKDHIGNRFTGTLKNLMGLSSPDSNRSLFHKPNWTTDADAIRHLDQCIADLNTIITPTLCVVDATEFIITNGPFGPGKLLAPHKVVVGIDRVAIDAYCCKLWDLVPSEIITISEAYRHGLGEIDPARVRIRELIV